MHFLNVWAFVLNKVAAAALNAYSQLMSEN